MAKLNLLSYILPPEDKIFFTMFQEGADICSEAAELYKNILENESGIKDEQIGLARECKRRATITFKKTLKHLNKSFITPLEPEDIQHIATLLRKIPKKIIKTCLNLQVYRIKNVTPEMKEQAQTLADSTAELRNSVHQLKKTSDVQSITKSNIKMKGFESHGDEILRGAIDDLFSGEHDAIDVIKYRDIYKEIENALDSCFSVSDTVLNIALKQS